MPKVQVDVPVEVHGLLRVEAARRGLSLARAVVELVRERLQVAEPVVAPARVVGRKVVRSEEPEVPVAVRSGKSEVLDRAVAAAVEAGEKPFVVKPARVPVGEFDRVSREVVESEWKPAAGLSKAEQAGKGRGRK